MDIKTFAIMYFILTAVAALFTEAIKKLMENKGVKEYSKNVVAFVVSAVIGGVGTPIYMILMNIPFDVKNIIIIVINTFAIWIGSMIGYDKVKQLIEQIVKK